MPVIALTRSMVLRYVITGVAFILYLNVEDASNCANQVNGTELFGRTIKASIAKDNGRSVEFIRKRTYEDKTSCYECGVAGHLSYNCPANILGEREPPPKKKKKPRVFGDNQTSTTKSQYEDLDSDSELEDRSSNPAAAISNKNKKRRSTHPDNVTTDDEGATDERNIEPDFETLSAAIQFDREKAELEGTYSRSQPESDVTKRKKIHKSSYFSDEEDVSD
uniref:Zinc finger CCHC-type and RNA-binding motif-containing protein 1 n=1 Tax=Cacopsylla melanoneura TaxID=428564 RepID=A0A8D9APE0_9HEMI